MRKSKRKEGVGGDRVSLDQGRQPTWPAGILVASVSHHPSVKTATTPKASPGMLPLGEVRGYGEGESGYRF